MVYDDRPIGIFDSGLGGLTVVRAMLDLVPGADVVYFGDTGRFPYGPKPADEVLKYSFEIVDLLLEHDVRMIVVACNSAAAAALDQLRERLVVPVVGVIEPGLRAARRATRVGRVGVIGTVGTVASGAYQRTAAQLDPSLELTCAACPGFVEFVERGETTGDQVTILAERLLAPMRDAGVDTLLLGCTHYPLLRSVIAGVAGEGVAIVDSATATASALVELLAINGLDAPGSGDDRESDGPAPAPASHRQLTTGDVDAFRSLAERIFGEAFPEVESIEVAAGVG
jgi:glutamate racemase